MLINNHGIVVSTIYVSEEQNVALLPLQCSPQSNCRDTKHKDMKFVEKLFYPQSYKHFIQKYTELFAIQNTFHIKI